MRRSLTSSVSPALPYVQCFRHLPQAVLHYHGIRKDLFEREYPNPYQHGWESHVVFVGTAYFDYDFLRMASNSFPAGLSTSSAPFHTFPNMPTCSLTGRCHLWKPSPISNMPI